MTPLHNSLAGPLRHLSPTSTFSLSCFTDGALDGNGHDGPESSPDQGSGSQQKDGSTGGSSSWFSIFSQVMQHLSNWRFKSNMLVNLLGQWPTWRSCHQAQNDGFTEKQPWGNMSIAMCQARHGLRWGVHSNWRHGHAVRRKTYWFYWFYWFCCLSTNYSRRTETCQNVIVPRSFFGFQGWVLAGLAYYISPPSGFSNIMDDPLHAFCYILFVCLGCVINVDKMNALIWLGQAPSWGTYILQISWLMLRRNFSEQPVADQTGMSQCPRRGSSLAQSFPNISSRPHGQNSVSHLFPVHVIVEVRKMFMHTSKECNREIIQTSEDRHARKTPSPQTLPACAD